MIKTQKIKTFTGLLILASAALGSACGFGKARAQRAETQNITATPTATATPYKRPRRESRDVIKIENKDEKAKAKQ